MVYPRWPFAASRRATSFSHFLCAVSFCRKTSRNWTFSKNIQVYPTYCNTRHRLKERKLHIPSDLEGRQVRSLRTVYSHWQTWNRVQKTSNNIIETFFTDLAKEEGQWKAYDCSKDRWMQSIFSMNAFSFCTLASTQLTGSVKKGMKHFWQTSRKKVPFGKSQKLCCQTTKQFTAVSSLLPFSNRKNAKTSVTATRCQ